jgi:hypothetical protein
MQFNPTAPVGVPPLSCGEAAQEGQTVGRAGWLITRLSASIRLGSRKGQTMLRAFSLALTLMLVTPAAATDTPPDEGVVAQQRSAPQTPRRDCEKNAEGIS